MIIGIIITLFVVGSAAAAGFYFFVFDQFGPEEDATKEKVQKESMSESVLIDSDNDGLVDEDEVNIYNTDPNNPDTDGDGYNNGLEIKIGYNPLGEGRLQTETIEEPWRIYTNDTFGYSVEIPSAWGWREFPIEETDGIPNVVFSNTTTISSLQRYVNVEDINNVQILKLSTKFSFETFLNSLGWDNGRSVTVANLEAQQFERPFYNEQPGGVYVTTLVKRNKDIFVIAGNFVPPAFSADQKSADELRIIYNKMLASMTLSSQSAFDQEPQEDQHIDIGSWRVYTNPMFGYSIKIHPDWKEIESGQDTQKRFRVYTSEEGTGSYDDFGNIEAELQILILSSTQQAVDFLESLRNTASGQEIELQGNSVLKIQNIDLDGCEAPQFFSVEGGYEFKYATVCAGSNQSITLLLEGDREQNVEKHKAIYDTMLSTFRFNQFQL